MMKSKFLVVVVVVLVLAVAGGCTVVYQCPTPAPVSSQLIPYLVGNSIFIPDSRYNTLQMYGCPGEKWKGNWILLEQYRGSPGSYYTGGKTLKGVWFSLPGYCSVGANAEGIVVSQCHNPKARFFNVYDNSGNPSVISVPDGTVLSPGIVVDTFSAEQGSAYGLERDISQYGWCHL